MCSQAIMFFVSQNAKARQNTSKKKKKKEYLYYTSIIMFEQRIKNKNIV